MEDDRLWRAPGREQLLTKSTLELAGPFSAPLAQVPFIHGLANRACRHAMRGLAPGLLGDGLQNRLGQSLRSAEHLGHIDPRGDRYFDDGVESRRLMPVLERRDELSIQPRLPCKILLREFSSVPALGHDYPDGSTPNSQGSYSDGGRHRTRTLCICRIYAHGLKAAFHVRLCCERVFVRGNAARAMAVNRCVWSSVDSAAVLWIERLVAYEAVPGHTEGSMWTQPSANNDRRDSSRLLLSVSINEPLPSSRPMPGPGDGAVGWTSVQSTPRRARSSAG